MLLNKYYNLSLLDYQLSNGIPVNDQICMLYNEKILPGSMYQSVKVRWKGKKRLADVSLPTSGGRIFVGIPRDGIEVQIIIKSLFKMMERSDDRYTVVIGKDKLDQSIDGQFADSITKNIDKVWANNVNVSHPTVKYLPLGRDFRQKDHYDVLPSPIKNILIYSNFSHDTHQSRQELTKLIKHVPIIHTEHMGSKFLEYKISRRSFYNYMTQSKFMLCPRGKAIDTFRMWDCLYLGTIPIVVKEAVFHDLLDDLPIYFINSYKEIATLTKKYLNELYEEMLHRKYNYNKLLFEYWLT